MMQNTVVHPKYRPDINGLRAVAILAVLIFHAFPTLLPGGFVGVDIFFVISGFLISTIIVQNLRNGSFSFVDFYARRIRRIFPALLLVLLSCMVLGWFSLLGTEYAQLGKHIAAGAGFVSNLALWNESGYFDTASSTKPLLHLWSLGIEEQFYLVWPLLLWLAWRKKFSLVALSVSIFLLSFGLNIFAVGSDAAAAYYSPLGRFWELLAGALLALKFSTVPAHTKPNRSNLLAGTGVLLIAISIGVLNPQSLFPGWWALLPVLGTTLLIAAGDQAWFNRHFLSNRTMVWIGLISYPLYLWHWPLLSFAEILAGQVPAPEYRLLCLLAAAVLAWLTYLVIERPYRNKTYRLRQLLYLGIPMVVIGLLGFDIFHRDGLSFRHEKLSATKPAGSPSMGFTSLGNSTAKEGADDSCADRVVRHTPKVDAFCHLVGAEPYIAVIGDSHANHLASGLKRSSDERLRQYLVVGTAGGCHPALRSGQSDNCDDQSQANLELIKQFPSIRYVVLSAGASGIQTTTAEQYDKLQGGYLSTIAQLQALGKTVIYLVDTPAFKASPTTCAPNPLPLRSKYQRTDDLCQSIPINKTLPRNIYNSFVQSLQDKAPNLRVIDAHALFCDALNCKVLDDNTLLFKDTNHLTDYGAKLLVDKIGAQL